MGVRKASSASAEESVREISIWVENLTEQEFELLGTYAKEGEPQQLQLPSRLGRSARLRWRCGQAGCAFAVAYSSAPASGRAAASAEHEGEDSGEVPGPTLACLSVGVVLAAAAAPAKASWVRSIVKAGSESSRFPEPGFAASMQDCPPPASGRAPSAQLGKLLAKAAPLGEAGGSAADGLEWVASSAGRDEGLLEVRLRLLPQGMLTVAPGAEAGSLLPAPEAPEESLDEEEIIRLKAWRQMNEALDAEATELERMCAAEPLEPARLRELPEMARIDLALALMMTLLQHRQGALRRLRPAAAVPPQEAWAGAEGFAPAVRRTSSASTSSASVTADGADKFALSLAKHAQAVYKALVPLVGFEQAKTAEKLSRLIKNYLPGQSGRESELEPTDPADFCRRLAVETSQTSENLKAQDTSERTLWRQEESRKLCEEGSETSVAGKVWLLEPAVVTSIPAAVRGLNLGILPCPGDYAAVFSKDHGAYFLLERPVRAKAHLRRQVTESGSLLEASSSAATDTATGSASALRRAMTFDPRPRQAASSTDRRAQEEVRGEETWPLTSAASALRHVDEERDAATGGAPALRREMTCDPGQAASSTDRPAQEEDRGKDLALPAAARPRPFAAGTRVPAAWLVARQLLALAISEPAGQIFDARSRAALFELCCRLGVPPRLVARWESEIGGALFEAMESSQVIERLKSKDKSHTKMKVAACAVGGGILCAVTGGLAAPALAAGLATVGAATASAGAAVGLTVPGLIVGSAITGGGIILAALGTTGAAALFGASGLGLTGFKLSKRWGELEEFHFEPLQDGKKTLRMSVDVTDEAASLHLRSAIEAGDGVLQEGALVPCAGGGEVAMQQGSQCVGIESLTVPAPPGSSLGVAAGSRQSLRSNSKGSAAVATRFRFERRVDSVQRAVHLAIFVSGWLQEPEDFRKPWLHAAEEFFPSSGHFGIKWETDQLMRLSNVFQSMMREQAASQAASLWWKSVAASTVGLAGLIAAWPIWVVTSLANLDNIWLVVANRATLAGECLAEVLADKHVKGQRPVTLVGHSMGARVIFHCLLKLHAMGEFHVVDDVVLLGTPVTTSKAEWEKVRAVTSGRVVNAYWGKDWVLAFLYRYLEWGISVAGLSKVEVDGVENINLKGLGLRGHHDYPNHVGDILAKARIGQRSTEAGLEEPRMTIDEFLG